MTLFLQEDVERVARLPRTYAEIHKLALDQRGRPVKQMRVVIGAHGREIARV